MRVTECASACDYMYIGFTYGGGGGEGEELTGYLCVCGISPFLGQLD